MALNIYSRYYFNTVKKPFFAQVRCSCKVSKIFMGIFYFDRVLASVGRPIKFFFCFCKKAQGFSKLFCESKGFF
jgi:hypothetical protein